ncbi:MAG: cation-translocating P-type ATPase [Spirochaetota bacterium]
MSKKKQGQSDEAGPAGADLPQKSWSKPADEILGSLDVEQSQGLSEQEVESRREKYGANQLRKIEGRGTWEILLDQFKSLIIYILVAAAVVSFARQAWIDGAAIVIVLAINTAVGFFTELRATRSIEALQEMDEIEAKVRRDGSQKRISAKEVVPGDIVILEAGELIPADVRIITATKLQADEAALTGESEPVEKSAEPIEGDVPLAKRTSMVFKGTSVTRGQGEGVVIATGMQTEIGEVSSLVENAEDQQTPLEDRLDRLGRRLVYITLGVAMVVGAAGLLAGRELTLMIGTAIALAIAAVPEGLPIVATVALARGMYRMLKRNALMRRLSSVETLGATNVICTDKTGTLTAGSMTVQQLWLVSGKLDVDVKADSGAFKSGDGTVSVEENEVLRRALEVSVLCNDAERKRETNDDGEEVKKSTGDPVEIALRDMGDLAELSHDKLLEKMPEVERDPFDSENKKMATVHESDDGCLVAVKGAPDEVIDACDRVYGGDGSTKFDDAQREEWREHNLEMAKTGLRVLGLATKRADSPETDFYANLELLGLVGFMDPPREAVREAVDECQAAGIRVIMVTGDQPETARHIANAVGLVDDPEAPVIHGSEFDEMGSDGEGSDRIIETSIFARVSPKQKLNLIDRHQDHGSIVAMTGDGVNDAPALKSADIGIAMGKRGTQVAKEAADMILQDDAFPTIVAAVEQGRIIFENIRKFVIYLLSGNVGEILAVAIAAAIGAPLPLLPLQILYLNVLNDAFPALALGVGGGDPTIMDQPPHDKEESIVTKFHWAEIIGYGVVIGANLLAVFYLAYNWLGLDNTGAVTLSFLTLSLSRLLHTLNMRHPRAKMFNNEITRNGYVWGAIGLSGGLLLLAVYLPFLADVLQITQPTINGWALVIGASFVPLIIGQIYIALFKSKKRSGV